MRALSQSRWDLPQVLILPRSGPSELRGCGPPDPLQMSPDSSAPESCRGVGFRQGHGCDLGLLIGCPRIQHPLPDGSELCGAT